jgi:hypothetical protein
MKKTIEYNDKGHAIRDERGYSKLIPGATPKPRRIVALADYICKAHEEIMEAENMTSTIGLKDIRTVKNYHVALARLKQAQLDLEEMTEKLHVALHGSPVPGKERGDDQ